MSSNKNSDQQGFIMIIAAIIFLVGLITIISYIRIKAREQGVELPETNNIEKSLRS